MHPIYGALLRRPDLLATHLSNYVALAKEEASLAVRGVAVRAAAGVASGVAILLALGLTGIAVMLGAIHGEFVWALVIVPGIAWLIGAIGLFMALRPTQMEVVQDLKMQVEADVAALRVAGETI
jgi:hypothetical protein